MRCARRRLVFAGSDKLIDLGLDEALHAVRRAEQAKPELVRRATSFRHNDGTSSDGTASSVCVTVLL